MNKVVLLTKFQDDTYILTHIPYVFGPMLFNETLAKAKWEFGISPDEIRVGLNSLKYSGHDIAVYTNGLYTNSYAIDYSELDRDTK